MIRICSWPLRPRRAAAVLLLLAAGASCSGTTDPAPTQKSTSELHILTLAPTAPAFEATTVSFWARKDLDREVRVRFVTGEEFMRFRVPAGALLSRPDGSAFAGSDSVLITITVTDPHRMAADFQPSGLRFSSSIPARLQWEFGETGGDINGDGTVNATDASLLSQIAVWRQETPSAPWTRLSSTVEVQLNEVQADITGFSGHALAY